MIFRPQAMADARPLAATHFQRSWLQFVPCKTYHDACEDRGGWESRTQFLDIPRDCSLNDHLSSCRLTGNEWVNTYRMMNSMPPLMNEIESADG
jgi:hypothetical protein